MTTFLREEAAFLKADDRAFDAVDDAVDVRRRRSLALLLRCCFQSGVRLSHHGREQYADHVAPDAFDRIQAAVQRARAEFGVRDR